MKIAWGRLLVVLVASAPVAARDLPGRHQRQRPIDAPASAPPSAPLEHQGQRPILLLKVLDQRPHIYPDYLTQPAGVVSTGAGTSEPSGMEGVVASRLRLALEEYAHVADVSGAVLPCSGGEVPYGVVTVAIRTLTTGWEARAWSFRILAEATLSIDVSDRGGATASNGMVSGTAARKKFSGAPASVQRELIIEAVDVALATKIEEWKAGGTLDRLGLLSCSEIATAIGGNNGTAPPPAPSGKVALWSGSGVIVSRSGVVATNSHVVPSGAASVRVYRDVESRSYIARVLTRDETNDLLLLGVEGLQAPEIEACTTTEAKLGQEVLTLGFPNPAEFGDLRLSAGHVSGTTGIREDPTQFTITAPIQAGNSGGGVWDRSGRLVGIVVASLSPQYMLREHGTLPENVNFAVHVAYLELLLRRLGLPVAPDGASEPIAIDELALRLKSRAVRIEASR